MPVRGLNEGHVPVARGTQDVHARGPQPLARLVDVVDCVGEVPEEAAGRVRLALIPVVRELDLGAVAGRAAAQEHEREASLVALAPPGLSETELPDEELERSVQVL